MPEQEEALVAQGEEVEAPLAAVLLVAWEVQGVQEVLRVVLELAFAAVWCSFQGKEHNRGC